MKFTAEDGTKFTTKKECMDYENGFESLQPLVGLTIEDIKAAVYYQNKELGWIIEKTGRQCAAYRVAAGDMKRPERKKSTESTAKEEAETNEPVKAEEEDKPKEDITSDDNEIVENEAPAVRKSRKAA